MKLTNSDLLSIITTYSVAISAAGRRTFGISGEGEAVDNIRINSLSTSTNYLATIRGIWNPLSGQAATPQFILSSDSDSNNPGWGEHQMKRKFWASLTLLIAIAAIIAIFAPAVQSTQTSVAPTPTIKPTEPPIKASKTARLLFLGNKNIAPVVYLNGTTPSGVAVDIVHALAKHMPQPVEIKAMDWSEAQALVAGGEADALIQINVTEERKNLFDFSDALLESHFSIFTRADKIGISGISSLHDLRVGVESGGLPRLILGKDAQIPLTIIPDFLEGFKQLNQGSIDAVVVDYRVGSYVLAKNGIRNIKVSGEPIESSYSSIAVKKGNAELLNAINNALSIIKADGTYQKIIDNWLPAEVVFETRQQIMERIYITSTLILLALLLFTVIWVLTTRKQLAKIKSVEEKLREQYSTLRGIIDGANALIFSVDREYRYTSFNMGHAAMMKMIYGAEIEQGHSLLGYMTVPEDREAAKRDIDLALAGKQLVEEGYSGDDLRSRRYFRVSHSPVKVEEKIIGVAVLAQDMTERKHTEEALQHLNRELRAISNCNQALMRAEDEQALLTDICHIICDEAGYRLAWVGYVENDDAKNVRPVAWAGFDSEYVENAKISWADNTERGQGPGGIAIRSGGTVYVQDFATDPRMAPWRESALQRGYRSSIALPLKGENAKVFGILLIYSAEINAFSQDELRLLEEMSDDLAFGIVILRARVEQKCAEEKIYKLNQELEQRVADRTAQLELTNKELKAFAYSVSHDLRAPLRHLDGFLNLLRERTAAVLDEQSLHYMATISGATKRMGLLIDDLLSFSRIGYLELSQLPVDMNGLVREVIQEFELETRGRTIHWSLAELPEVTGDRALLRMVAVNLLSNALKFTQPRPQVEIEVGFTFEANEIIFFVRDNGVGFDMHYADKLFGVFQRLHPADEFEGTGIGLANVRRIIARHGGRTWAQGEVDKGATFYFSLPKITQGATGFVNI